MTPRELENVQLTRTDAGTPMGKLFRRYWMPAARISDVPENDGAPFRVQLLGEKLVMFRDTSGRIGLVDEFCAHRRVSLWFGRNEEDGLRCPYHGWKYDVNGNCVDIPSEAPCSKVKDRMKLKSYPCIEQGGLVWTYMGPPELQPEPPALEWTLVPEDNRHISLRIQESNYLQAMEGGIDSSHVAFLHDGALRNDPFLAGVKSGEYYADKMPHFDVEEFEGGLLIGVRRKADDGKFYWRVTPWIAPAFNLVPPRGNHPIHAHAWVPRDDHTCWVWNITFHPSRALSRKERATLRHGASIHSPVDPVTLLPAANKANDYLMDRNAQIANINYSGVPGVGPQDASLQESMGSITDRSLENLVSTDKGIVMVRRSLLKAMRANEEGMPIPGLSSSSQRVASCGVVLEEGVGFVEGAMHAVRRPQFTDPLSL